jgi:hypothetical protein
MDRNSTSSGISGSTPARTTGLLVPFCLFFLIYFISPSHAGIFHTKAVPAAGISETLACSQCHTMHGSQGGSSLIYGGTPTTYEKLLRSATSLDLCLWCHENTGGKEGNPPDVMNNTTYTASAGDFRDRNVAHDLNRHDIGRAGMDSVTPPGYSGAIWTNVTDKFGTTFNCIYCHDQHGNKNYRNLRYHPSDPANDGEGGTDAVKVNFSVDGGSSCSDAGATPCDVEITLGGPTNSQYSRDTGYIEFFKNGDSDFNRISQWCGRCHTDFYGLSGDAGGNMGGDDDPAGVGFGDAGTPWTRHPVGDIDINTAANTNLHADNCSTAGCGGWLDSSKFATVERTRYADGSEPAGIDGDEQPFCLSCHYAHGGGNPNNATNPNLDHSMLVFMDNEGDVNIEPDADYSAADGMITNTCQQCHNQ